MKRVLHELVLVPNVLFVVEHYKWAALMLIEDSFELVSRLLQELLPLGFEVALDFAADLTIVVLLELLGNHRAPVEARVVDSARNRYFDWLDCLHFELNYNSSLNF